jgi:repressor LexA
METLTDKQQEIIRAIRTHINDTGHSPTVREIGLAVHLRSSCSVQKQIETLERLGKIRRSSFKYRSIEVVGDESRRSHSAETIHVPLLGTVVGGHPKEVDPDSEPDLVSLPTSLLPRTDQIRQSVACDEKKYFDVPLFAMRVEGKSMIDAGIDEGDLIVVRSQPSAENGNIVVARTEDFQWTVKKYYREEGRFRLQPANDAYEPIYTEHLQILGKVVMAIKQF